MRTKPTTRRRAAAATELAVCMPMIALLVFGCIQACDLVYLKHAITSAAYEGSLELIRPSATNTSVATRVGQVLDMRQIGDYEVNILPAGTDLTAVPVGQPVEIQVRAKVDSNLVLKGWFSTSKQMEFSLATPR